MEFPRASGILLHPTSLPSAFGIGDLGAAAYQFADFLARTKQYMWQVLPLGPTGYGDSPYQCFSAFAGNPLLISPEKLAEDGLLSDANWANMPPLSAEEVDYGAVIEFKHRLFRRSFEIFKNKGAAKHHIGFDDFRAANESWLNDFALFMALKDAHGGQQWTAWEPELATRQPDALAAQAAELADEIEYHKYLQYQFFKQWGALKEYVNEKGIKIVGDIPIFVAHDSADVWANPHLFFLDELGNLIVQAGVPPDYFSETGQLWGNPLYRWDLMAHNGYKWWIARFEAILKCVDIVRLDHFRGFAGYWEVPGDAENAIKGRWAPGPGAAIFDTLRYVLGELPIIAEDLGVITPDVDELRDRFGFPGMRILQFSFGEGDYQLGRPFWYPRNCVVYTGTHDNDTTVGWFTGSSTPGEREFVLKYVNSDGSEINWDMIRVAWSNHAVLALAPMQDLFGLGTETRMNYPSKESGNWQWRFKQDMLTDEIAARLTEFTEIYGRVVKEEREDAV